MRVIAQRVSRACSTVSREVARHGGRAQYRANQADQQAWESALRPKPCLLATQSKLQEIVASKLMQDQLPSALTRLIASKGHHASHVLDLGLDSATDTEIWNIAAANSFTLITKDEDFSR
jgi:transposase, IS30 family